MILHDPFAMRPFFGYNFGDYCKHWLSLQKPGRQLPKIFHVNWFRKSDNGKGSFLWPGFGENTRVIEWIFKRTENLDGISVKTPIGLLPTHDGLDLTGLSITQDQIKEMLSIDKNFWLDEVNELKAFFDEYVNESTPKEIYNQIDQLKKRVEESN